MKYWKYFWNNLNLGWKRIHYVMLIIPFVLSGILADGAGCNPSFQCFLLGVVGFIFFTFGYVLLVTIILWIMEGLD